MTVEPMSFVLTRPPQDDNELYELVHTLWGVRIPRIQVCPDHCSPFDAFAEAYFGRVPVSVWVGSRGFGGKSRTLAYLTLTEAVVLGAECNLLGGSFEQSRNIHEAMRDGWDAPLAPRQMVVHHGAQLLRLSNGAKVRPLTASQRTVRGPHPQRLRLDEIDEMDISILDAAMGQPMPKNGIDTQTVMSSTWQYPDKCVGQGTLVWTQRGEIPVENVTTNDSVMTRQGWRKVLATQMSGYKPVVKMELSNGRTLTTTLDHRIALMDGSWSIPEWFLSEPSTALTGLNSISVPLASTTDAATAPKPSVFERMSTNAMSLASVNGRSADASQDIFSMSNGFQMSGITTGSNTTQMIDSKVIDRSYQANVGPSMSPAMEVFSMDPSISLSLGSFPDPATVVVDIASALEPVFVIDSHIIRVLQPVYDLEVEEVHEFVAEGIVVHNTMTEMVRRAGENGWPVRRWCYLETSNPIDGWLAPETIDRKRTEVSKHMFEVEYDLQEPSVGNRAIDTESVEKMFSWDTAHTYTQRFRKDVEQYVFEEPDYHGDYVIAADWAKEVDRTVISVWRHDEHPHRLVAFWAGNRMPYPRMIAKFDQWLEEYGARGIHDATGLGGVVADTLEARGKVKGFLMSGRARDDMLSEYIAAIERNELIAPRVSSAYSAHKYASVESVYGKGKDNHLPDEICSFALAWHLMDRGKRVKPKPIIDITKEDGSYWRNSSVSTLPRL